MLNMNHILSKQMQVLFYFCSVLTLSLIIFQWFSMKLFYLVLLTQAIFYKTLCGYFFKWPKYIICNSIVDGQYVQQKTLLTYSGLLYKRQHNQASILLFNIDKMSQLAANLLSIT